MMQIKIIFSPSYLCCAGFELYHVVGLSLKRGVMHVFVTCINIQWLLTVTTFSEASGAHSHSHCRLTPVQPYLDFLLLMKHLERCVSVPVLAMVAVVMFRMWKKTKTKKTPACCSTPNALIMRLPTRLFLYTHTPTIDRKQQIHIQSQRTLWEMPITAHT